MIVGNFTVNFKLAKMSDISKLKNFTRDHRRAYLKLKNKKNALLVRRRKEQDKPLQ